MLAQHSEMPILSGCGVGACALHGSVQKQVHPGLMPSRWFWQSKMINRLARLPGGTADFFVRHVNAQQIAHTRLWELAKRQDQARENERERELADHLNV